MKSLYRLEPVAGVEVDDAVAVVEAGLEVSQRYCLFPAVPLFYPMQPGDAAP